MSAAILYHVQGIRKHFLRKISIKKGIFIFECFWRHPEELKCAGCRSGNVRRKGTKMRIFTGVPMGNMRTRIHAEIPRVHCLDCGKVAQIHIGLARPNVRYTRYFERFVRDLLQGMTCQATARSYQVSWDTVYAVKKIAIWECDNACVAIWECDNTCCTVEECRGLRV